MMKEKKILSLTEMNNEHNEPLLNPTKQRFSLFPIKYLDLWKLYKEAKASFWQAEEILLETDKAE